MTPFTVDQHLSWPESSPSLGRELQDVGAERREPDCRDGVRRRRKHRGAGPLTWLHSVVTAASETAVVGGQPDQHRTPGSVKV